MLESIHFRNFFSRFITGCHHLISQKMFIKSFCRSHFPHKSVNLFFISVMMKDELTSLCGD